MAELTLIRGDSKTYNVTFTDSDGDAIDITGATVFFTVKADLDTDDDTSAVIQKTVTSHTNPTAGQTSIVLTSTDTDVDPESYYYDIQLKKADGTILSIPADKYTISSDVTRRTAAS